MNTFVAWTTQHRAQLAPVLFGAAGLYFLLPREHRVYRPLGLIFGIVALALLGFSLQPPGATLHGLLFYIFAGTAILAAASTVSHHNPIYSALSFAVVTLSICGLFVLRGAQFLAAATVIIYAGAIVVTFLFIIMLARQSGNAGYDRRAREPFLATLASFVLLAALLFIIEDWLIQRVTQPVAGLPASAVARVDVADSGARSPMGFVPLASEVTPHSNSHVAPNEQSPLRGLGRSLFSDYLIAVELAGTLLLVAGVGAVAIAPRRTVVYPTSGSRRTENL